MTSSFSSPFRWILLSDFQTRLRNPKDKVHQNKQRQKKEGENKKYIKKRVQKKNQNQIPDTEEEEGKTRDQ